MRAVNSPEAVCYLFYNRIVYNWLRRHAVEPKIRRPGPWSLSISRIMRNWPLNG